MRRLHDPTLHFFVVWLLAPIFAIVGASLDQSACDLSTTQVGWLITLSLWNGFGIRSVVYQEQPAHVRRRRQSRREATRTEGPVAHLARLRRPAEGDRRAAEMVAQQPVERPAAAQGDTPDVRLFWGC
jgi:hypothetical protein